ncbi:MAG: hypothetical protein ABL907_16975 [Hyphomicrobium sp.]
MNAFSTPQAARVAPLPINCQSPFQGRGCGALPPGQATPLLIHLYAGQYRGCCDNDLEQRDGHNGRNASIGHDNNRDTDESRIGVARTHHTQNRARDVSSRNVEKVESGYNGNNTHCRTECRNIFERHHRRLLTMSHVQKELARHAEVEDVLAERLLGFHTKNTPSSTDVSKRDNEKNGCRDGNYFIHNPTICLSLLGYTTQIKLQLLL